MDVLPQSQPKVSTFLEMSEGCMCFLLTLLSDKEVIVSGSPHFSAFCQKEAQGSLALALSQELRQELPGKQLCRGLHTPEPRDLLQMWVGWLSAWAVGEFSVPCDKSSRT